VSARDATEDALCDAVHDAFLQFWRVAETEQAAELWAAYLAAQARYDAYLMRTRERPSRSQGVVLTHNQPPAKLDRVGGVALDSARSHKRPR
jgi:hypothetical protein